MALTDPQSIKINGVTSSLPRISTGENSSTYQNSDGTVTVKLSTTKSKINSPSERKRHMIRVDVEKITEDPFSGNNIPVSMSFYMVIDRPKAGYTNTEALAAVSGLLELSTASESSVLKKLLGSES